MLNYIWMGMILASVLVGGLLGNLAGDDGVVDGAIEMAKFAVVNLAIPLGAIMILWLGIMRLAEVSGIVSGLARLIPPLTTRLFPDVPADHPAMGAIIMNIAANMLGLGNAATPLGLRAMGHLENLNRIKGTASNAMCTFLAINTSSVTLIPATAVAMLAGANIDNPYAIVGPAIGATTVSTIVAIIAVKILEKLPVFRLPAIEATGTVAEVESVGDGDGEAPMGKPARDDKPALRAGIGGRGIAVLALIGVMLAGVFALEMFPGARQVMKNSLGITAIEKKTAERREAGAAIEEKHDEPGGSEVFSWRAAPRRLVNAVSVTAIPFVFVVFIGFAAVRGVRVYEEFIEGAKEGFNVALRVMPYMVAMLVALGMFRNSGALMLIEWAIGPALDFVGFPVDLLPMALMRPLSGSGSLGVLGEILATNGISDTIKYTAATMFGSTETTFYILAVYFGSVGIRRTRHALPAGLIADAAGIIAAIAICKAFFG